MESWNCHTTDEALQKLCQESFNRPHDPEGPEGHRGGPMFCKADLCMAWMWSDYEKKAGFCGKTED